MIPVPFKYRLLGDKTLALHRTQVNCAVDCSDPAGWTTAPREPYGRDFYYDENGNLTVDKDKGIAMGNNRGLHFFYDERNLPVQIGEFHYRYTGDGQRYYKEVNGAEEYYVMDGDLTLGVFSIKPGHAIDTQGSISEETEPNESWQQASGPVGVDPVSGVQDGWQDQDWYYLDVLEAATLQVSLEKEGMAMVLAVYDEQLNQLAYDDSGLGARLLGGIAAAPGRYYIEVSPREQHSQQIPYTLQVTALDLYWNLIGHGVEGRYVPGSGNYFYHKDHLGSTRAVVNATGTVLDAFDYYPFLHSEACMKKKHGQCDTRAKECGLEMPGRSVTSATGTKEMFTGHERDQEVGLDYMVARRYNAALGRFLSVDSLADEYSGWSPYHYVLNNPVLFIDPTGMCPENDVAEECVNPDKITFTGESAQALINILAQSLEKGQELTEEALDKAVDVIRFVADEGPEFLDILGDASAQTTLVAGSGTLASLKTPTLVDTKASASATIIFGGITLATDLTATGLSFLDYAFFDGSRDEFRARLLVSTVGVGVTGGSGLLFKRELRRSMLNRRTQRALNTTATTSSSGTATGSLNN